MDCVNAWIAWSKQAGTSLSGPRTIDIHQHACQQEVGQTAPWCSHLFNLLVQADPHSWCGGRGLDEGVGPMVLAHNLCGAGKRGVGAKLCGIQGTRAS